MTAAVGRQTRDTAAFDFPNAPSTGQLLTGPGGVQYRWDGIKWVSAALTTSGGGGDASVWDGGATAWDGGASVWDAA